MNLSHEHSALAIRLDFDVRYHDVCIHACIGALPVFSKFPDTRTHAQLLRVHLHVHVALQPARAASNTAARLATTRACNHGIWRARRDACIEFNRRDLERWMCSPAAAVNPPCAASDASRARRAPRRLQTTTVLAMRSLTLRRERRQRRVSERRAWALMQQNLSHTRVQVCSLLLPPWVCRYPFAHARGDSQLQAGT